MAACLRPQRRQNCTFGARMTARPEQDVKLLRRPSDVKQALGSVRPLGDGVAVMLDGYSS